MTRLVAIIDVIIFVGIVIAEIARRVRTRWQRRQWMTMPHRAIVGAVGKRFMVWDPPFFSLAEHWWFLRRGMWKSSFFEVMQHDAKGNPSVHRIRFVEVEER